ncbi:hypothetical protein [Thalassovita sp.]|uniref:hypothetical protein n=1 Tax=Thalassovita sp. TaxID=1979401 RepID=UPI002B276450|nr:hypothetical protein [Thalassovita sp.]
MKIHLASFADGAFHQRKVNFRLNAEEFGAFDTISIYDKASLPENFAKSHGNYMTNTKRGFGYWIWKPVVILETLQNADPDDCILYTDAGYTLNPEGKKRFSEYVELTMDSKYKMLSFQNMAVESHYTKADLASRLGLTINSTDMKTTQLTANIMLLKPTLENIDLIREWIEIGIEKNYHYSDDSPSETPNHPEFKEHRHDQSIASLLRKMRGTQTIYMESSPQNRSFEALKKDLPAWCTRRRE